MKARHFYIAMLLLILSCSKPDDNSQAIPADVLKTAQLQCGSDLAWLQDIIKKADEDKATRKYLGNYRGTIYLTTYNNSPAFMIDMMMGSGGLAYYAYDCSGARIYPAAVNGVSDFYAKTVAQGWIVYSNIP